MNKQDKDAINEYKEFTGKNKKDIEAVNELKTFVKKEQREKDINEISENVYERLVEERKSEVKEIIKEVYEKLDHEKQKITDEILEQTIRKLSKIRIKTPKDGKDGTDGQDGKDAPTLKEIIDELKKDKSFLKSIKGKDGKPGRDGIGGGPGSGTGVLEVQRMIDSHADDDSIHFVLSAGANTQLTSAGNIITISAAEPLAGSGETNTASNVGGETELFKQKSGVDLEFRTLSAGPNVNLVSGANVISISAAASGVGSGETNTASNVGSSNEIFKQKSGVDLEFRTLSAGENIQVVSAGNVLTISGTPDTDTTDHTALSNIGTNSHTDIDNHITSASVHFTEASIDHTNISNIGSNSHTDIDNHISSAGVHFFISAGPNVEIISAGDVVAVSAAAPLAGSGETNTASNVGGETEVFKQKSGVDFEFRTLSAGANIQIVSGANILGISAAASGAAASGNKTTTRITTSAYSVLAADEVLYFQTSASRISASFPAGVNGKNYRCINVGTSGNSLVVIPDGTEKIHGINTSGFEVTDGNTLDVVFEPIEGWW